MTLDIPDRPLNRFAPRIQELRQLAPRFPALVALSTEQLAHFVRLAPRRPLTALSDEEVTALLETARSVPARRLGSRIVDVGALYEDTPPVLIEMGVPPRLHVAVVDEASAVVEDGEWWADQLLAAIRRRRPRASADADWTFYIFRSLREFLVLRTDGPARMTAEQVRRHGPDGDSQYDVTSREQLTDAAIETLLRDYYDVPQLPGQDG